MGFEALLNGFVSRGLFLAVGMGGAFLCVWGLVVFLRRSRGMGGPTDMAQMIAKHRGDVVEAAADVRTVPIGLLGALLWMIVLASAGLLGPNFGETAPLVFSSAIGATVLIFVWMWVEKEFAVPGFLVDRRVRGVPGRRKARREGIQITPEEYFDSVVRGENESESGAGRGGSTEPRGGSD